jgi:hypothetical protein
MPFEFIPSSPPSRPRQNDIEVDRQSVLEGLLINRVNEVLEEEFAVEMSENGFTPDEITTFRRKLHLLDPIEANGALSIPKELLSRRLEALKKQNLLPADMVSRLHEDSSRHGFRVGYHVSNRDIRPQKDRQGNILHWCVIGTEPDHRNNDIAMAYYSLDLEHLYRKKKAAYLYLIRAITGADTTHRMDNDNSWGRAPRLDIISRLDLEETLRGVEEKYKSHQAGKKLSAQEHRQTSV